jgi:hypothetical protein
MQVLNPALYLCWVIHRMMQYEELAADEQLNELENQTIESMEYEFIDYNYYEEIIQYYTRNI